MIETQEDVKEDYYKAFIKDFEDLFFEKQGGGMKSAIKIKRI